MTKVDLPHLREALEASWGEKTSYLAAKKAGNPSLGQCYPTPRVIQHFFPETEIVKGKVCDAINHYPTRYSLMYNVVR